MNNYQAGQDVEVRAEIYPAVGVPVFGWHKAKIISVNNAVEQVYVEFPTGLRNEFDSSRIRPATDSANGKETVK